MLLKLTSGTCSLCEDNDVSLSEGDTKQYIRFIKEDLGSDLSLDNAKSFRVCLLCTHSLDLLKDIIEGIENHNVKSCFCCKSTSNLFKQSDLPKNHKVNVTSFASTFKLRGLNICLHCFYAINFWIKLKSFLESSKQSPQQTLERLNRSSTRLNTEAFNNKKNQLTVESPRKKSLKRQGENDDTFKIPSNVFKIPEIKRQVQRIKMCQYKLNKAKKRKFSEDKKLIERVPFVFLTRMCPETNITPKSVVTPKSNTVIPKSKVTQKNNVTPKSKVTQKNNVTPKTIVTRKNYVTPTIEISDDSCSENSLDVVISRRNVKVATHSLKVKAVTPVKKFIKSRKNVREESSGSENDNRSTSTPVRNFRNRPLRIVVSPLKDKQLPSPIKKKIGFSNGTAKSKRSTIKNKETEKKVSKNTIKMFTSSSDESAESDNNSYSVTSSGSNTGIVIKRISRDKHNSDKAQKQTLSPSTLRTIRIQTKKSNTSSSSDQTDISQTTTPRSPVTLPPKKNRKRMMDLSHAEYFEPSPAEKPSPNDSEQESESLKLRPTRQNRAKILIDDSSIDSTVAESEKDPLEIVSSDEDLNKEDTNKSINIEDSSEKLSDKDDSMEVEEVIPKISEAFNEISKRLHTKDSSDDIEVPQENVAKTANSSSQPSLDKIVSKYLDLNETQSQDDTTINDTQKMIHDLNKSSENVNTPEEILQESTEELNSLEAVQGTEQINIASSLITPALDSDPGNLAIDSIDLALACIHGSQPHEEEETAKENRLNLQLTPEVQKNISNSDTQSTVLMSNDNEQNDIFNLDTQIVVSRGENEDATTKASSQSSNYQDALDTAQTRNIVTVLQDVSFTKDNEPDKNESNASMLTEDESDGGSSSNHKRKRNDTDNDSESDADETPRTKRVRFATERKVLNEDDTVCLENFEGNDDQQETENTQKSESEVLCALDL